MGMAASQARWISLAARKTNVEYEGQQINQARTALANKSSALWNQLYDMEVPTPPNTSDYTKTQYSFTSGNVPKTITKIDEASYTDPSTGIGYNSYVTYTSKVAEYTGIQRSNYNPQVHTSTDGTYYVGNKELTKLSTIDPSSDVWSTYVAELDQILEDKPNSQVAKDWKNYKNGSSGALADIYFWVDTAGNENFVAKSGKNGLTECMNDEKKTLFSYYSETITRTREDSQYAFIEYDSSGRATSIQLQDATAVYDVETESVTDNNAYNDAMNQYNYNKQKYEKRVQDINARTEQIQTEDRTLELRLKALDTEQQTLQTEMDVVRKVISKNIDNTFKTFEGS